jgi:hypothetical protein
MSADAKMWIDDDGNWKGLHDGACGYEHQEGTTSYDLSEVLRTIEACMDGPLRWKFRIYPDGHVGLVGYRT